MPIKLGFSTGSLHKNLGTSEAIQKISEIGCEAVELGFVKGLDLEWISKTMPAELDKFKYVSMHAPKFAYAQDQNSLEILKIIDDFHKNVRQLDMVVFHPDPIKNFEIFKNVDFPVGIENMDHHKSAFKKPGEIMDLLKTYPNFKVVLDVNHVYTNDNSMQLAAEFYRLLGNKIAEIHLSGFAGYHEPLFQTGQDFIFESIENLSTPIIIEGVFTPETVGQERDYVLNLAQKHQTLT